MKYSPPIDGLRALAVGGVLVFHAAPPWMPGGFVGVDVFFVLSGYLIIGIIVRALESGRFGLARFYVRRFLRLLPASFAVLLATVVFAWLALPSSMAVGVGEHAAWTVMQLSNVFIWQEMGDYWGSSAEGAPLLHTWSLAVEEQFYLLVPVSLMAWYRAGGARRGLVAMLLATTLSGFAVCVYGATHHPVANFYLLPSRVWELAAGGLLAIASTPDGSEEHHALHTWVGWTGVGLIAGSYAFIDESWAFPGWVALAPVLGTLCVLWAVVGRKNALAKWLGLRGLVNVGKWSYSIYLWHWPAIVVGRLYAPRLGLEPMVGAVVGAALSLPVAWMSYHWVETPMRHADRRRGLVSTALTGCAALVFSMWVSARQAPIDPTDQFDEVAFLGRRYDAGAQLGGAPSAAPQFRDVHFEFRPNRTSPTWREGGVQRIRSSPVPQVVVLGSSHALMWSSTIDAACEELDLSVAFFGVTRRRVIPERGADGELTADFDRTLLDYLSTWKPRYIVVADRWDTRRPSEASFREGMERHVEDLSRHGSRVLLLSQPPVVGVDESINLREYALWSRIHESDGTLPEDDRVAARAEALRVLGDVASKNANVSVLRVDEPFAAPGGRVRVLQGRDFYFADDDHLSEAGARQLLPAFLSALRD